ncbi:MAG: extracellular solute-binding protein [Corynebacterium sp.]|nr:extracellular solute-binding protein [Corynebacterium sp.]
MTTRAKEELGVDVQFVTGGGGDLTSRIKQEKHNSQADLVLGVGEAQLAELDAEGLFEPYTPEWADKIPSEFAREDAGYTLFSQTPVVMAYNPEVMSESEAPSRWEDLAKPEYKDKFVLPSVTGQTGQAFMVGVLWRYADPVTGEVSDEGWETLEGIMSNSLQLAQGEKFDWNRVVSGEVPIHVSWLGGIQVAAEDFGITMEPIDAEGGSPFVNTGVGVIKGGDTGQAQEFIDWFGSAQLQTEFVNETNNDTPLNEDALKNLPEQRASIESVTPQEIDWAVVSENLTEWMQRVQLQVI